MFSAGVRAAHTGAEQKEKVPLCRRLKRRLRRF
jgi:hypothetical protein